MEINKSNTEGMELRNADGSKVTAEQFLEHIRLKESGQLTGGNPITPYVYYKTSNDILIKYDEDNFAAMFLNKNEKWQFSEEITQILIQNPSAFEREYYVRDNYENEEIPRKSK